MLFLILLAKIHLHCNRKKNGISIRLSGVILSLNQSVFYGCDLVEIRAIFECVST